jgi:pyrimidine-nucleoside phosphorylase
MRAVDVIVNKRDGEELSEEEIRYFIQGYTQGDIPDYQAAAWLMAIYLQGMTDQETEYLTMAMAHSGDVLDLSDVAPLVVDKHSTGGVGDKVSLVLIPTLAASGLVVGKMSGRGLGFTGGTLDKLESIPGFHSDLTVAEFKDQLRRVGIVLASQTGDLAPADGKLYALRDVTGTISALPLIVSSVMSKKIAGGADAIVLDVKVGSGAFMKTVDAAVELAEEMVKIGTQLGRRVVALISDMNQPLGRAVGNALEVQEAIDTLRGEGPEDFRAHCLRVASEMLSLVDQAETPEAGRAMAEEAIETGAAWGKFVDLIRAQGGDVSSIEHPDRLPRAGIVEPLPAPSDGYLQKVNAAEVGLAIVDLGGGRTKKGEPIDHAVGVVTHKKVGDPVEAGEPLLTIHANDEQKLAEARQRLETAYTVGPEPVDPLPLFYDRITAE